MSLDVKGRPSSESRFMEGKGRSMDGFFDEVPNAKICGNLN
jgi:hypothetical protein